MKEEGPKQKAEVVDLHLERFRRTVEEVLRAIPEKYPIIVPPEVINTAYTLDQRVKALVPRYVQTGNGNIKFSVEVVTDIGQFAYRLETPVRAIAGQISDALQKDFEGTKLYFEVTVTTSPIRTQNPIFYIEINKIPSGLKSYR